MTKQRATQLSVDQVRSIDHFVESLLIMFPHMMGVAHVGSSLVRDDWRDVDLRVVLANEDFDSLMSVVNVDDLNMLLSRWGQQVTGLPIDCQTQSLAEHNGEAYGENGEPRHRWRGAGVLGTDARLRRDTAP